MNYLNKLFEENRSKMKQISTWCLVVATISFVGLCHGGPIDSYHSGFSFFCDKACEQCSCEGNYSIDSNTCQCVCPPILDQAGRSCIHAMEDNAKNFGFDLSAIYKDGESVIEKCVNAYSEKKKREACILGDAIQKIKDSVLGLASPYVKPEVEEAVVGDSPAVAVDDPSVGVALADDSPTFPDDDGVSLVVGAPAPAVGDAPDAGAAGDETPAARPARAADSPSAPEDDDVSPVVGAPAPIVGDAPAPVVGDAPAPVVGDAPAPVVGDASAPVVGDAVAPENVEMIKPIFGIDKYLIDAKLFIPKAKAALEGAFIKGKIESKIIPKIIAKHKEWADAIFNAKEAKVFIFAKDIKAKADLKVIPKLIEEKAKIDKALIEADIYAKTIPLKIKKFAFEKKILLGAPHEAEAVAAPHEADAVAAPHEAEAVAAPQDAAVVGSVHAVVVQPAATIGAGHDKIDNHASVDDVLVGSPAVNAELEDKAGGQTPVSPD